MNNELNQRISREIFNREWIPAYAYGRPKCVPINQPPDYSGNIADAWLVVEELAKRENTIELDYINKLWFCCIYDYDHTGIGDCMPTAPLAICHAALDIVAKLKATP